MKPIILDGAFGTCLWEEAEKRGVEKVSTWRYNIEHPELVEAIINAYDKAGSEIIYSNTFVAIRTILEAEHKEDKLESVIRSGLRLVREASDAKLAYSVGPLSKMMEPFGTMTRDEVIDVYKEALDYAVLENPDYIVLETFMDLNMLEAAASVACQTKIPLICSMTFPDGKRTLLGNSPKDMAERLKDFNLAGIGTNCSVGPELTVSLVEEFKKVTKLPLLVKPNAGELDAKSFAKKLAPCLKDVGFAGACCGSSPEYIKYLAQEICTDKRACI